MPIHVSTEVITFREGSLTASVPRDGIKLAHVGCMLVGKVHDPARPLSAEVVARFVPKWRNVENATGRLGTALAALLTAGGLPGLVLIDTLRKGSDAWRPGAFLTAAADCARRLAPGARIGYAREDDLCPPPDLLARFMAEGSAMTFNEYAAEYADYLRRSGAVEVAVAVVLRTLAGGQLPVFYCTDPYIPGYADPAEFCSHTPYRERRYQPALRTWGCHRFVLAEEVIRFFSGRGVAAEVLEADQGSPACHRRAPPVATVDDLTRPPGRVSPPSTTSAGTR